MTTTTSSAAQTGVPVMRPLLPQRGAIAPYLDEIDTNRWYSNYGPLVQRLERRLEEALGAPDGGVMSAGNGTAALAAALIALDLPKGSLVAVPSWTFCATAHAVAMAGHVPYLIDVDPSDWALAAERVEQVRQSGVRIAAAMPVSPFGAPLDVGAWRRFRNRTGIPVVVDAAAAFDTWRACEIPAVISLHATKVMGCGEGGMIVCGDPGFCEETRRIVNFGFAGLAVAEVHAFNGKMNEYNAAVGLAALDQWAETRRQWQQAASFYAPLLGRNDVHTQSGLGRVWVGSVLVVHFPSRDGRAIAAALGAEGIATRPWWPLALHEHPAFAACPWNSTEVAGRLSRECLGLPFFRDIRRDQAERVMETLDRVLDGQAVA